MEFSLLDDALEQIERQLPTASGRLRQELLLALSWHLRQRDTRRALILADQVQAGLSVGDGAQACPHGGLRVKLIQGEARWLAGEFAAARDLANQALQGFTHLCDSLGCADAHYLQACIAFDENNNRARDVECEAMLNYAHTSDPVRSIIGQVMLTNRVTVPDPERVNQKWGQLLQQSGPAQQAIAGCWRHYFLGVVAGLASDHASAIHHYSQAHAAGLLSGQIRLAIFAATDIGESFTSLNDYDAALEWMQRGMDLARRCAWPIVLGVALSQIAGTMLRLQRLDAARALLHEALRLLAPVNGTRYHARALRHMGDIELESGQYDQALTTFQLMGDYALKLNHPDLLSIAQRGQAHALSMLDQPGQALVAAQAALQKQNSYAHERIVVLKVIANIHARHVLPAPPDMRAASTPLHYLQQALDVASTIEGYIVSGSLLDFVAREYAKVGRFDQAYEFALQADAAREKTHSLETGNRALAIQVKQQTEQVRIEREHQRQLAASEAQRAQALQQTSTALAQLGAIGQEIAAHLDFVQIFDVIKTKVHQVLDMSFFGIYFIDEAKAHLNLVCSAQEGPVLLPACIALDHPFFDAALCVRERRQILVDLAPGVSDRRWTYPCSPTLCRLFAPLLSADRVLGVLTIHSFQRHAYGEREQLFFRTLCAYIAIALSNAKAHGELSDAHSVLQNTQQQLLLQEKMAGLGTLTAGVAHEINNPTNFVHVSAQNMQVDLQAFEQFLSRQVEPDDAPEMVNIFARRFGELNAHVTTVLNGTARIKGIVQDLRRFTRLDEANKKRVRMSECLISTLNLVRSSWLEKVEFITEFKADPEVDCWPALLNQAFMNLLVNGCQAIQEKQQQQHAQTGSPERGKLWLRLDYTPGTPWVDIRFEENGIGIAPEALAQIMQPFYSTRIGAGGAGLGLSTAHEIVQKHGGSIAVQSTLGQGSCFSIKLPA